MTKDEIFAALKKLKITKVEVKFSGGGDEGGVEMITLFDGEGTKEMKEYYESSTWNPVTKNFEQAPAPTPDELLSQVLCKPVYDEYSTFAGDFHVSGTVTWDVEKEKVIMKGSESIEEYEYIEKEL